MYKIIYIFFACALLIYGVSACTGGGGTSDNSNLDVKSICLYDPNNKTCTLSVNWSKLPKATGYTIEYRNQRNINWNSRYGNSSYNLDYIRSFCDINETYQVRVMAEGEFKAGGNLYSDIITCYCL